MTKITDLLQFLEGDSFQYNELIINLFTDHSDLPFTPEEKAELESSIISKINGYLNKADTRTEGLNIITSVISKCSKDVLGKYGLLWITKATQVLDRNIEDPEDLNLTSKVLGRLIISSKKIAELQKEVSMHHVKQLIPIITKIDLDEKGPAILYPLITLMYYYKESAEKYGSSIKKWILQTIDSEDKSLVQASANCYSVLTRVTEKNFKLPEEQSNYDFWTYQEALLCNTIHSVMDDLFSDLPQIDGIDIWGTLDLPKLSEDNIFEYYFGLERRFHNLCTFLSTMLRGCMERNSVFPEDILKLTCRGLAITPAMLRKDESIKSTLLTMIIPKLHIQLLNILNCFIQGFMIELLPYTSTILKLYVQSLKWISKPSDTQTTISGNKPFISLKIAIYKSLSIWLKTLGRNSGVQMTSGEIIPFIFTDITPEKLKITLTMHRDQNLSKKAKKRVTNSQYENSAVLGTASDDRDPSINADLCREALCILADIFYNTGSLVSIPLYEKSQELIVNLLYDIYLEGDSDFYTKNKECRLNLLKALRALLMNIHPQVPPPVSYATQLFNLALEKEDDADIKNEAKQSLAELDKIIHPSAPSLLTGGMNRIPLPVSGITEGDHTPVIVRLDEEMDYDTAEDNQNLIQNSNTSTVIMTSGNKSNARSHSNGHVVNEMDDSSSNQNLENDFCDQLQ